MSTPTNSSSTQEGLTSLLKEVKQKLDEIEQVLNELKNYVMG